MAGLFVGIGSLSSTAAEKTKADSITLNTARYQGRVFPTSLITNTAAVGATDGEKIYKTTSESLLNSMPGLIPGFTVQQGNEMPGISNAKWLIRGIGSYVYGRENESKIYVDGFEVDADFMDYMTPSEIESVSILKDAAALSIFGMNGSNGVIWIRTKRGNVGKPRVVATVRTSLRQPINVYKPLNSYDYASLYNQAASNDNGGVWTPAYSDVQLNGYLDGSQPDIDWHDRVIRNSSNYTDASVGISGGVEAARYNINMGYSYNQGLFNVDNADKTANLGMARYNLRANLDMKFLKIFEAKVDIGGRLEDRKSPNYDTWALINDVATYPSNAYWIFDDTEGTKYSGTTIYPNNPVGSMKGLGWKSMRTRIMQGNFTLRENLDFIAEGLYLQEAFSFYSTSQSSYSKTSNYARWHNGATTTTDKDEPITAGGYGSAGMIDWKQGNFTLGYSNSFGRHSLNAATAYHISDRKSDGVFGYKFHTLNWYNRVNYNYDSRYTAEAGFSYFGSDAYASGNRWGFYPYVSGAWIVSNEQFMNSCSAVDLLKLRASVGKTGAQEANSSLNINGYDSNGRYLYQQYYYWNGAFNTGNSTPYVGNSSIAPQFIANPKIFAEQSMKYDIGVDAMLLGKIDITADVFLDKRSRILTADNSIMGYYGNTYYLSNIGKMTNKGFEIGASFRDKVGEIHYSVFGMVAMTKNKIDYMAEVPTKFGYNAQTGLAYGTPMGLIADGFYGLEDFEADGSLKAGLPVPMFGKVQPGDIRYRDMNGDNFIDDTDITDIGKPAYPKVTYSFGAEVMWKGFDLSFMLRGAAGSSVDLMNYPTQMIAFIDNRNAYPVAQGAWAYYPAQGIDTRNTATYPRLSAENNENNYRHSSFWIVDNNFLRIQNIELGYDFCYRLVRNKTVSKMRLFVNATNPVTWSKLLKDYDMDPESGFGYPALKSFSIGFSITL